MVQSGNSRYLYQLWRSQQRQVVTVILDDCPKYVRGLILCSKSMTVALTKCDLTAARAAYHQMSENGKSAAMTQYLMYKIAIQENDDELGKYLELVQYLNN
jgi:hypothetical protein